MTPINYIKKEESQLTFLERGVQQLFEDLRNKWKNEQDEVRSN